MEEIKIIIRVKIISDKKNSDKFVGIFIEPGEQACFCLKQSIHHTPSYRKIGKYRFIKPQTFSVFSGKSRLFEEKFTTRNLQLLILNNGIAGKGRDGFSYY